MMVCHQTRRRCTFECQDCAEGWQSVCCPGSCSKDCRCQLGYMATDQVAEVRYCWSGT